LEYAARTVLWHGDVALGNGVPQDDLFIETSRLEHFDADGRLLQEPEREEAVEVVEILPLQQAGVADTTNYFTLRTSSSATTSCSLPVHGGP